ncbi:HK97 family phage prohead protease [Mesorhizobium sp. M1252]|uniref:HK97 family phage prohead protease n=1 Tax=Mesorhizobium sp. M1252 TaxID=2957073 RepID=UPI00333BC870
MLIAGHAIAWGVACNDEIVVGQGAFENLIRRGFQPKMLLQHEGEEIGKWIKFEEDDRGLLCVGELSDSPRAKLARDLMETGKLTGLSMGRKKGIARPIASGVSFIAVMLDVNEISMVDEPGCPAALLDSFCIGGQ